MNQVNIKNRNQLVNEFDSFTSENQNQSDSQDNQPVTMDSLQESKRHIEGDISFETNEHNSYDPTFSETSHKIKDHQDTSFVKVRNNI